jgi:hypothetical protein
VDRNANQPTLIDMPNHPDIPEQCNAASASAPSVAAAALHDAHDTDTGLQCLLMMSKLHGIAAGSAQATARTSLSKHLVPLVG